MKKEAYFATAEELARGGLETIPPQMISGKHLIYSSPATLAFNSPGAEGFGVKRAGLAVPDSIMLIVAPGCCGRNTSLISSMPEYNDRFFYLMMDETDIVTGRHLKKIPKAVKEICDCCEKKPSVVMICITCVDALLGTDMERVCRKAEEKVDIPVRPCYMYALTREGRKPPMVHVRQSLYSLLEPQKKKGNVVNLLGFFSPLVDDCEMYELLQQAGVKTIHEISRCKDYEEYQTMSQANFNLVLHPEARFAAEDFHDRLKIPFIELRRLYQTDKIENQYRALGQVLGVSFDQEVYKKAAEEAVERFREVCPDASFAVGECMNGDPFELALAWCGMVSGCGDLRNYHSREFCIHTASCGIESGYKGFFQYGTHHAVLRSVRERSEPYHRKGCRILSPGSAKCRVESGPAALWLCRGTQAV